MRADVPELLFATRDDFRAWLSQNAGSCEGIWLIFSKTKAIVTISAVDALEEALCFGWIDGQMKSIDKTKYIKYFAKRRPKSVWSVKNKDMVAKLCESGKMTQLGLNAIEAAKKNGMWEARTNESEHKQIEEFKEMLLSFPHSYETFTNLSPSAQLVNVRWYHSYKTKEKQQQVFKEIVAKLDKN